jgi:hypothetical protein
VATVQPTRVAVGSAVTDEEIFEAIVRWVRVRYDVLTAPLSDWHAWTAHGAQDHVARMAYQGTGMTKAQVAERIEMSSGCTAIYNAGCPLDEDDQEALELIVAGEEPPTPPCCPACGRPLP